ncbi:MAG: hypothetical protein M3518_12860 [Actinomycetota bacterium]|nr:hypothetical protein [Actinomycetota bacterium]
MNKLRILLANEPRSYREAITGVLGSLYSQAEVVTVAPEALDSELKSRAPQLVIRSHITPAVQSGTLAWVKLYPEHEALAEINVGGRHSTIRDIELTDCLSAVDQTESLTKANDP